MAQDQPAREEFVTTDAETGNRLDRVLAARITELSRTRIKALILAGEVSIGGHDPRSRPSRQRRRDGRDRDPGAGARGAGGRSHSAQHCLRGQ
jgi:hypothetical protein